MLKYIRMVLYGGFEVKALLRIRSFRRGIDEEVFVRIFNAVFSDYEDIPMMNMDEMRKMEEAPSFNADGMLIAEWDREAAGMVDGYVDKLREEEKGFIRWLGVLPQFRRRGIARKLVEKALESLRARKMKVAEAWAQSDREGCIRLFESFGFKKARVTSMMRRSLCSIPVSVEVHVKTRIEQVQPKDNCDVVLLNRLDNEAFKEHFNFRPRTIEETRYMLLEEPWFQKLNAYFAFLDSQPAGHIVVGIDENLNREKAAKYGWVLDIGVLKPFRRRGIGKILMLHGMRVLKDYGMEDVLLYVDDMNPTGAMELYRKLGFEVMRSNLVYQLPLA